MKAIFKFLISALLLILLLVQIPAQQWQAVPLVSQSLKDQDVKGGEGCQVILALEIDAYNGDFLIMGTDVGGIYRSTNGGESWEPCNVGYSPRGNCGFAIDPNNENRVLAFGSNSTENFTHGIYLSSNKANTWKSVLKIENYKNGGLQDKGAYDKSSFDSNLGYSKVAYWSCPSGGFYRSADGGESWTKVNNGFGSSVVKVHPT